MTSPERYNCVFGHSDDVITFKGVNNDPKWTLTFVFYCFTSICEMLWQFDEELAVLYQFFNLKILMELKKFF